MTGLGCLSACLWACVCLQVLRVNAAPFNVYWNVPSVSCHKFNVKINVSQFGLLQNAEDKFNGDKMNILYRPGAFPYIDKAGRAVRGGVPQRGSLPTHGQRFINTVNELVPLDFEGAAVLDFENYYPSFDVSAPAYRQLSEDLVRASHPDWSPVRVEEFARASFNDSAKDFFQVLLWMGRELRPKALWGYYHYPYCNDWEPYKICQPETQQMNLRMPWLYEGSVALYPSLYIMWGRGYTPRSRRRYARNNLQEALAMRRRFNPTAPVLPYLWYRYHDDPRFLTPVDFVNTLGLVRLKGGDGAVVWGGSADLATEEQCRAFKSYAENQLGPLVQYLAHLPRAKLRSLLASRGRLRKGVKSVLRKSLKRKGSRAVPKSAAAADVDDDMCMNRVVKGCRKG